MKSHSHQAEAVDHIYPGPIRPQVQVFSYSVPYAALSPFGFGDGFFVRPAYGIGCGVFSGLACSIQKDLDQIAETAKYSRQPKSRFFYTKMKKVWDLQRIRYATRGIELEPSRAPTKHTTTSYAAFCCGNLSSPEVEPNSDRWFYHLCGILFPNASRSRGSKSSASDCLPSIFGPVLANDKLV